MDREQTDGRPVMIAHGSLPAAEGEALGRALAALPRVTAPADLWARIQRRIQVETVETIERRRRRARMRRLVPAFAPLAAAALLILAFFIIKGPASPPLRPPPERGSEGTRVAAVEAVEAMEAMVLEHTQLANEPFVGGDDLLVAECAFPADVVRTSDQP